MPIDIGLNNVAISWKLACNEPRTIAGNHSMHWWWDSFSDEKLCDVYIKTK